MNALEQELLEYILPAGLLTYFTITKVERDSSQFILSIEEKKLLPEDLINEKVHSNGFFPECTLQDFPLRGRKVFFKIKRRRWEVQNKSGCFSRDWNFVAKGTRLNKEFASFLKELPR